MTREQVRQGTKVRIADRQWGRSFGRGWRVGQEGTVGTIHILDGPHPWVYIEPARGTREAFYFYLTELELITPPSRIHGEKI